MRPYHFFAVLIIGILIIVTAAQVPISNDWVASQCGVGNWCPSADEFWSGIYSLWLVVSVGVGVMKR